MNKTILWNCSKTFENGVTVVNATPHPLNFIDMDGTERVIPTSVPAGEKTGPLVINAKPVETRVDDLFVRTKFEADPHGLEIIDTIEEAARDTGKRVVIIGSMIAVNAFPWTCCWNGTCTGIREGPTSTEKDEV